MLYPNNNSIPSSRSSFDSKYVIARAFSIFFLTVSLTLACLAAYQFALSFLDSESIPNAVVKSINIAVISLAIFELGVGVNKEYTSNDDESESNIYVSVRRSITRFVAVVCVALVLEGLIMVIKYSQLELAGNLGYPVAIIAAASVLLLSLGGFLRLTNNV